MNKSIILKNAYYCPNTKKAVRDPSWIKSINTCEIHQLQKNIDNNELIKFIKNNVCNDDLQFMKSFDILKNSGEYNENNLLICLINHIMVWFKNDKKELYDFELCVKYFNLTIDTNPNTNLGNLIKKFIDVCGFCSCTLEVYFNEDELDDFGIYNRPDILYKILSEADFKGVNNIINHIHMIMDGFENNLKSVKRKFIKNKLINYPKPFWNNVYEKYIRHNCKLFYLRDGIIYTNEELFKDDSVDYIHLYGDELEPEAIERISLANHSYCMICDAKKNIKTKIYIHKGNVTFSEKKYYPHICRLGCMKLLHEFGDKISTNKNEVGLNIYNLRYVTNIALLLLVTRNDDASDMGVFNDDLRKYIILCVFELVKDKKLVKNFDKFNSRDLFLNGTRKYGDNNKIFDYLILNNLRNPIMYYFLSY